ncbi:Cmx/CmrA family chloramphenicol efflux MFS transporter [Streptomyces flavofungini]|uniref:MFS transporter n=1 Tax=Streptomyces flavofungini TaxID=68200 RepID=A0ABS0X535_9ACTN|nr:Cmx/CmrA family chloramphenicol efflux MFS transporter [Streptomyces flavofungini]MBJ3808144.1 MFS transporter [Streptomyces flavofungini]GHC56613.1 chloramphenicol efflux pump [Streptomyces flavofungini]
MPLAVYVLALGIFTQGTSEFMLSGLLPGMADDLGVSIPDAGLLISAFAIGMVVGAPLLAVATLRWPRRTALVLLQAVFIAGHVVGALAPGYGVLFATRIVSALAYAGFWGVAVATAVALVPSAAKSKAVGLVAGGLTLATIVGVPAGTVLSQSASWRAAFWAVAAATAVSLAATALAVPGGRGSPEVSSVRAELRGMKQPQLWLSYAITGLAFGAVIVTFSYLAALLTDESGLSEGLVPAALALFGAGGMLGLLIGSRTAQAHAVGTLGWGLGGLAVISAALALTADTAIAVVLVLVFLLGMAGYVTNPALQSRVFGLAPDAPTLVGATNTAAFNVGNTLAPMLGGLTIGAGYGYTSVAWVGAGLAGLGGAGALWAGRLERATARTQGRAPLADPADPADPTGAADSANSAGFEKVFQNG